MPDLVVPPAIDAVILQFNDAKGPYAEHDVKRELDKARSGLQNPTESENFGAWAEVLAFALVETRSSNSPWGTYFGPMGSGTDRNGKTVYLPDIADADAQVVSQWAQRAKTLTHPVLNARYADLAWDLCNVIAKTRRDPQMARIAIDAYIASVPVVVRPKPHDRFMAILRALDLAIIIKDFRRIDSARVALLQLHREEVETHGPLWRFAFDRLIDEKNARLTDAERQQLVDDLKSLICYYGDKDPQRFNPHALFDAAKRLIPLHTRLKHPTDVRLLHKEVGRTFEHFAGLGDAMLASAALQTTVNAYRAAGLPVEAERARVLMEQNIGDARAQMAPIETEFKIPHKKMEEFLELVVPDDPSVTFVRIAAEFLANRRRLEEEVQK
ncbi:MAG: hypothetical protein HQL34_13645, partial [Alphaproteobacteria bacterium]|nr:hypothetical protein [Alphaproteobacteria bacterium]